MAFLVIFPLFSSSRLTKLKICSLEAFSDYISVTFWEGLGSFEGKEEETKSPENFLPAC